MTLLEELLANTLGLIFLLSIIGAALVSRYFTARNELRLIELGKKEQVTSWRGVWVFTVIVFVSLGFGTLAETLCEPPGGPLHCSAAGSELSGLSLLFAGVGVGIYLVLETDDNG